MAVSRWRPQHLMCQEDAFEGGAQDAPPPARRRWAEKHVFCSSRFIGRRKNIPQLAFSRRSAGEREQWYACVFGFLLLTSRWLPRCRSERAPQQQHAVPLHESLANFARPHTILGTIVRSGTFCLSPPLVRRFICFGSLGRRMTHQQKKQNKTHASSYVY